MAKVAVRNIIVFSDIHAGCQLGLCPPKIRLDSGGSYQASRLQLKTWEMWNFFWKKWVPQVTRGEEYVVVNNGDTLDGNHHNSVTQITHNLTDQRAIAYEILAPVVNMGKCAGYYHIRGTEAHGGQSGQDEEELAKQLGTKKDEDGSFAPWEVWMRMGISLIHFTHHVGTTSSAAYESTAPYKELVEAYAEAGRWHEHPPDCIVRSHRHRAFKNVVPTESGDGLAIVTPGWQLKTPHTFKFSLGRSSTPQMGGILLRHGDEDMLYSRSKVWGVGRPREVRI